MGGGRLVVVVCVDAAVWLISRFIVSIVEFKASMARWNSFDLSSSRARAVFKDVSGSVEVFFSSSSSTSTV